jgi:hypothetical protein
MMEWPDLKVDEVTSEKVERFVIGRAEISPYTGDA